MPRWSFQRSKEKILDGVAVLLNMRFFFAAARLSKPEVAGRVNRNSGHRCDFQLKDECPGRGELVEDSLARVDYVDIFERRACRIVVDRDSFGFGKRLWRLLATFVRELAAAVEFPFDFRSCRVEPLDTVIVRVRDIHIVSTVHSDTATGLAFP